MKKKVFVIVFVLLALVFLVFACDLKQYVPELPSRFARYHNTGSITVTQDGKVYDLNGTKLSFEDVSDVVLTGPSFKFKKGIYGENVFSFVIPDENIGEINIKFGQMNFNWWHVCDYDIRIDITSKDDGTVDVYMKRALTVEGVEEVIDVNKTLTKEDNVIVLPEL